MHLTRRRRGITVVVALAVVVAVGCQHVVATRITQARVQASVPGLLVAADLKAAAQASATRMCDATAASESPDLLALDSTGFAVAMDELVGSAVLDAGIEDENARARAAIDEIWATWAGAATLVDPRWNEMGVADTQCADGRLYLSTILRDSPPGLRADGKTSLFMGQELGAVGGFPGDHDQGYVDYVGLPAGVTTYNDLRLSSLLRQRYNLGTGDICSQCYVDSPTFDGTMIALGLYLVGDLPNIISGARNANIDTLGTWITDAQRPVFLRIGYEFDGSWNSYDATLYKQAFRYIVDRLRANGVDNVVTVWQASGYTRNVSTLMRWYPGDEYVDWVGYSYFNQSWNPGDGILEIARSHRKPAMVAEAAPKRNLSLGDPTTHWNTWFGPFFDRMKQDSDVIKAVAYINTRWFDQPGWDAGWGDSRVQIRPQIKANWIQRLEDPMWAPGDFSNAGNQYVLTPHDLTPP